jgi:4-hydroxy-tetrahydrodipicolinate synthase
MDHAALARRLADVVAIPVCPFDADGAVDGGTYAELVRRLVDAGVGVVTPNGNTGEYYALGPAERRTAVEVTVEAAGADAEVLVGVGHDVASAVEESAQAQALGASMIMIHQPVHPYISMEGWLDYHTAIAQAVPDLGVVLYLRDARVTAEHASVMHARTWSGSSTASPTRSCSPRSPAPPASTGSPGSPDWPSRGHPSAGRWAHAGSRPGWST